MKFATYKINGKITYGSVVEQGENTYLTDIGATHGHDLRYWLEHEALLGKLKSIAANAPIFCNVQHVEFLPPIVSGQKIVCIGVNYAERNAEYKDNSDLPKYPSVFLRYLDSFVGHHQNLVRPPESLQLDYEGEIVLIIGKGGRRISKENASQHIAGLTLMNEGTIRDWVRHAKFNVTQGKNFEKSGAIGPYLVTTDEFEDFSNLQIQTRVNGELRQDDTTARLMFPFDYIVSYLSTFMTLKAGDMIATGTPNGAGARFEPPIYLKPNDIVEITATGLGVLRNGVEDEKI
jgi:2-keto-4-pentenoate hydratase/2-oxohepta-3-ene-1,7-dioic acid hydratase in catechol pathway